MKNQDVDENEMANNCCKNDHEMNWKKRKVIDAEPYIYAVYTIYFFTFLVQKKV